MQELGLLISSYNALHEENSKRRIQQPRQGLNQAVEPTTSIPVLAYSTEILKEGTWRGEGVESDVNIAEGSQI